MPFSSSISIIGAAVRAASVPGTQSEPSPPPAPSVTISRESGIDTTPVADELVRILNAAEPGKQWIGYDRALVERVARDHDLSEEIVSTFSERDRDWFSHFAAGLPGSEPAVDVGRRVAQTVRGLARVGRAVLVGRGGQCVLAELPHVLHVRLYAPLDWRVEQQALREGIAASSMRQRLQDEDAARVRFIKNHFRRDVRSPELYGVQLNMSQMTPGRAARAISHLVPGIKI
jgi:cytidylate kinase